MDATPEEKVIPLTEYQDKVIGGAYCSFCASAWSFQAKLTTDLTKLQCPTCRGKYGKAYHVEQMEGRDPNEKR